MTSSIDPNQLSTDTATSGAQGSGAFTPWFYPGNVFDELDFPCVVDADQCIVASVCDDGIDESQQERHARLIAAAPAMYEALKDLLSAVEAQAQHAARVNTHSDAHLWEPSELLMKPARDALAAVDGRA